MMALPVANDDSLQLFVGTLVGESTSQEFRLAVAHETIREQDIIAVDAELRGPQGDTVQERIRVWAKVQRIERINPLFPMEAGHELAATRTNPLDTVLSLSREMVTAVCQVLGAERLGGTPSGKLEQLRYPAKPATIAFLPTSQDIARIVLGKLEDQTNRALDIATLANRPEIDVKVDGHAIVTRHLAILAMTGAGKSWTARRIIEQLAAKSYPMVIFDPHGDYTGLADIEDLDGHVQRYYAHFPIFEHEPGTVLAIVESLTRQLADTHRGMFDDLFEGASSFISASPNELHQRVEWLSQYLNNEKIARFGLKPNLFLMADFTQAVIQAGKQPDTEAMDKLVEWSGRKQLRIDRQTASWLTGLPGKLRGAAKQLKEAEDISKRVAGTAAPLPTNLTEIVRYGGISIITLAGYKSDLQATLYTLIAEAIFSARVSDPRALPVLLVLEEAHNFVPGKTNSPAEERAVDTTRKIAQEGRKFRVGLILISQRPSRLDETALSQCNSYIVMRMANPADQSYMRRVIENLAEDEARLLPTLANGEAILSGQLINFPVLVSMKPPKSKGEREEEDAFIALEKAHASMNVAVS